MKDLPKFHLRIEGQGEYFKGARYLWIKSVTGFNDKEHCKKCLKGKDIWLSDDKHLVRAASYKLGLDYPFECDNKPTETSYLIGGQVLHYLCIGSRVEKSKDDYLHIGFIFKQDSEIRGNFKGQTIIIKNAKNLHFDFNTIGGVGDSVVRRKYSHLDDCFTECRNFWFGAYFYGDKI